MIKGVAILGELNIPEYFGIKQYHYRLSGLQSKTWEKKFQSISELIAENKIQGIIAYLPTPLLVDITFGEYQEIWHRNLDRLKEVRLLVVVYEQNLLGNFDFYDYDSKKYLGLDEISRIIKRIEDEQERHSKLIYSDKQYEEDELERIFSEFQYVNNEEISDLDFYYNKLLFAKERIEDYRERQDDFDRFLNSLLSDQVELVTFKDKKEVFLRVETFISNLANDIVFSLYVNSNYFLSGEFDDLINIMTRYLNRVEGFDVRFDKQATKKGTLYHVKTETLPFKPDNLKQALKRFDEFMDVCVYDPDKAAELLRNRFEDSIELQSVISDLTKRYKRLLLDVKHQREKIMLLMRQDFESELMNIDIDGGANLILNNFESLEVSTVSNPYDRVFMESYSDEEQSIISIAKEHENSDEVLIIKSNLDQMKDSSLPEHQRQSAAQKVKSYLFKIGKKAIDKAEDLGIKILVEYIDKKVNQ